MRGGRGASLTATAQQHRLVRGEHRRGLVPQMSSDSHSRVALTNVRTSNSNGRELGNGLVSVTRPGAYGHAECRKQLSSTRTAAVESTHEESSFRSAALPPMTWTWTVLPSGTQWGVPNRGIWGSRTVPNLSLVPANSQRWRRSYTNGCALWFAWVSKHLAMVLDG